MALVDKAINWSMIRFSDYLPSPIFRSECSKNLKFIYVYVCMSYFYLIISDVGDYKKEDRLIYGFKKIRTLQLSVAKLR